MLRGAKAVGHSVLEVGTPESPKAWSLAELEILLGGGALSWPPCPSAAIAWGCSCNQHVFYTASHSLENTAQFTELKQEVKA